MDQSFVIKMKYWHDEWTFDDLLYKNSNQEHTVAEDEHIQFTEGLIVEEMDPHMLEELEKAIKRLKIIRHRQQME
jgi:hypothetical protein